jgi:HlyD family type I secretion membrane fusion protein
MAALKLSTDEVQAREPSHDWKRPAMLGYLVIVLTFGVMGVWSAFARLDSAVVAPGVVSVESNRKTLQHFEGGMVKQILVREGQHVQEGDILFRLDNTLSQANAETARNQLHTFVAQETRLRAERDDLPALIFPAELTDNAENPVIKDALFDQQRQFVERRASLVGQFDILESRMKQSELQIQGTQVEQAATEQQLKYINQELVDLRDLSERNLVQRSRVFAQERERARLEGVIGRATADIAKLQNDIGEAQLQIAQIKKKFAEDVNSQIVDVRTKIADLREKVTVSQDVLQRIEIRAPRSGSIQNMKVATIGGVIRAGEPLADLIPDDDGMIVNAMVTPTDIDAIKAGMSAEVRFSAFHGQILPLIMGHVESVSRDRLTDEQSKQPYFLARVVVNAQDVPANIKDQIRAGMSTEVVVPTGERTALDYLVRPLRNRVFTSLRER